MILAAVAKRERTRILIHTPPMFKTDMDIMTKAGVMYHTALMLFNGGIICAGVILFANVAKSGFLKNTRTPPAVLLNALTV